MTLVSWHSKLLACAVVSVALTTAVTATFAAAEPELKASHVSMLSQPKAVAAVIMDAAEKSGASAQTAEH